MSAGTDSIRPASRLLTWAVFASMVGIWGTTWLVIRVGVEAYPPFFSLAVRFTIASTLFLLIMKHRGDPIPWRWKDQPPFIAVGLLTFVTSFGIVYWGEQYLSSGLTAIIFALMPLFTGVFAHWMIPGEKLRWVTVVGLVLGVGGIALINASDLTLIHPRAPIAAALMIISPIVVAISSIVTKRNLKRYPHLAFSAVPMAYGAVAHLILWRVFEADVALGWDWRGVGSLAYLVLFGSMVTFTAYNWLLTHIEVSRLNLTAYITPMIALAVGVGVGGESLTLKMSAGVVLVLIGVAVANRRTTRKPQSTAAAG